MGKSKDREVGACAARAAWTEAPGGGAACEARVKKAARGSASQRQIQPESFACSGLMLDPTSHRRRADAAERKRRKAAERERKARNQRAWRQRYGQELAVVGVTISFGAIHELINAGYLGEHEAEDRREIGRAITAALLSLTQK